MNVRFCYNWTGIPFIYEILGGGGVEIISIALLSIATPSHALSHFHALSHIFTLYYTFSGIITHSHAISRISTTRSLYQTTKLSFPEATCDMLKIKGEIELFHFWCKIQTIVTPSSLQKTGGVTKRIVNMRHPSISLVASRYHYCYIECIIDTCISHSIFGIRSIIKSEIIAWHIENNIIYLRTLPLAQ